MARVMAWPNLTWPGARKLKRVVQSFAVMTW